MKHLRWLMATALAVTVTACSLFTDLTDPTIALNIPDGSFVRPGDVIVATAEDQESGIARLEALFNTGSKDLKAIPEGERDRTPVTVEFTIPTDVAVGVAYDIEIIATNGVGRTATETYQITIAASAEDTTAPITSAPEVRWQAPVPGLVVGGIIELRVRVTAVADIEGVEFEIRNAAGPIVVEANDVGDGVYAFVWDTRDYPEVAYTVKATAVDASGRRGSESASFTVDQGAGAPIGVAPSISWLAPVPGSELLGSVELVALVDAPAGVSRVEFVLTNASGSLLLPAVAGAAGRYAATWETGGFPAGSYDVTARIIDDNARVAASSAAFSVLVGAGAPAAPVVRWQSPAPGTGLDGQVDLRVRVTADAGLAYSEFEITNAAGSVGFDATDEGDGVFSFSWDTTATPDGAYTVRAIGVDVFGRQSTVTAAFTVLAPVVPDAPTVVFAAPFSGEMLSGDVPVTLSVAAPAGLGRVDLLARRQGGLSGQAIAVDPVTQTATWQTGQVPNGAYVLIAMAVDLLGQVTTVELDVELFNLLDAFWVEPAPGATVGPSVDLRAGALGSAAVANVIFEYTFDGTTVRIGEDDAPVAGVGTFAGWDTAALEPGTYQVLATVRDVDGRTSTVGVNLTVPVNVDGNQPSVVWLTPASGAEMGSDPLDLSFEVDAPAGLAAGSPTLFLVAAGDEAGTPIPMTPPVGPGPYTSTLAPDGLPAGNYVLRAVVRDVDGREATSTRSITALGLAGPEAVRASFLKPSPDRRSAGLIDIDIQIEAGYGLSRVELFLESDGVTGEGGRVLIPANTGVPLVDQKDPVVDGRFVARISTLDYENGDYTLVAIATDQLGNVAEERLGIVFLTPFVIVNPLDGELVGGINRQIVAVAIGVNGTILDDYVVTSVRVFINGQDNDVTPRLANTRDATDTQLFVYDWDTAADSEGHVAAASGDRIITALVDFTHADQGVMTVFTPGVLVNHQP